jgi:hypothetical protein
MAEKMMTLERPRVFHWAADGVTGCGLDTILMVRVKQGQRGDFLPACAKCERRLPGK